MTPQYISMCRKAKEIQNRHGFPRGAQVVVMPYGKIPGQTTGRIVSRHPDYKQRRKGGDYGRDAECYMVVVQGKIQAVPKSVLIWIPNEEELRALAKIHWREFDARCDVTFGKLPRTATPSKVECGLRVVMRKLTRKRWDVKSKEWVQTK